VIQHNKSRVAFAVACCCCLLLLPVAVAACDCELRDQSCKVAKKYA
jgi:hypothetical protein